MTPHGKISSKISGLLAGAALILTSCGGGGGTPTPAPTPTPTPTPAPSPSPTPLGSYVAPALEALSIADVQQVIANAVAEARTRNLPSVIAVTDRVGNVLAVFFMVGARMTARTSGAPNGDDIDIQDLEIPAGGGAIAKAVTGAYLSSGGNAFSTRTASMIVQEHFPPAPGVTNGLESGPLFGVQFSQLPCSDFSARFGQGLIGPKRSPLGLAADSGGLPLYKNGVLVGGVGVMGDGDYGFDPDVRDLDNDAEEYIALAGTRGFEAPEAIRADRQYVDGTQLRFSDARYSDLATSGNASYTTATNFGILVQVPGYADATIIAGTAYGTEASGIRQSTPSEFSNRDAFVFTNGAGVNRFPIRGGTDGADIGGQPITADEARAILEEAFAVMTRARAQIRQPLDSRAQVSISLVDTRGEILGMVRAPDAPIFGSDVSLQKARTATFFSGPNAASDLNSAIGTPENIADIRGFVTAVRAFLGDPNALTGTFAFADRSGGNLSRPYFPDGEVGRPPGPLSRPIAQFNPFSTGLQSALVLVNLAQHLDFVNRVRATDTPQRCTFLPDTATAGQKRLENGIQIFPGSVPVYRGNQLIGGIGVSGDGIDQDDMISFLGLNNAGVRLGTLGNAPKAIRADNIIVDLGDERTRLRFVNCPFAPFLDTAAQNVCQGL